MRCDAAANTLGYVFTQRGTATTGRIQAACPGPSLVSKLANETRDRVPRQQRGGDPAREDRR